MDTLLFHTHLLVKADVLDPPITTTELNNWFVRLVDAVNMRVFIPPQSKICTEPGNEGITGIVAIETSHSSVHIWTSPPGIPALFQFDLYSCKEFDVNEVLLLVKEFSPVSVEWILIDRNENFIVTKSGYNKAKSEC